MDRFEKSPAWRRAAFAAIAVPFGMRLYGILEDVARPKSPSGNPTVQEGGDVK